MNRNTIFKSLRYLPFALLLILAIWPATRWIVANQFGYIIGRTLTVPVAKIDYDKIAAQYPNDYYIQLAAASKEISLKSFDPDDTPVDEEQSRHTKRMEELVAKFPNNPSAYAALICAKSIKINGERPDIYFTAGENYGNDLHISPPRREDVDSFLLLTRTGERLDPDNAFFPFMSGLIYFADKEDAKALNALHKASHMHHFNTYGDDVVTGNVRLFDKTLGTSSGIAHLSSYASLRMYSKARSIARMAIYTAIADELNGRAEQGYIIRNDILRLGSLMRSESNAPIGVLVSIAIFAIGQNRPGGEPRFERIKGISDENWQLLREQRFYDYLDKIGHHNDIAAVKSDNEKSRFYRKIVLEYSSKNMDEFNEVYKSWTCGFLAPICLFWFLLISCSAPLLPLIVHKLDKPFPSYLWLSVILGIFLTASLMTMIIAPDAVVTLYLMAAGLGMSVISAICLFFVARRSNNIIKGYVAAGVIAALLILLSYFVKPQCVAAISSFFTSSFLLASIDKKLIDSYANGASATITGLSFTVLIIAALYSQLKKISMSRAIAKSYGLAAYVVMIAYIVIVLCTLGIDRGIDKKVVQRHNMGEMQYYAKALGRTLPESTKWRD